MLETQRSTAKALTNVCLSSASTTVVHRTDPVGNTLDPTWRPFTISVRSLCNGDYERCIKLDCHSWKSNGSHHLIGSFETSLQKLNGGKCRDNVYECVNGNMKKDEMYRSSGTVELMSCVIRNEHTFLDFIKGGTNIHCTIAIDFSASNGDPRQPSSLHYVGDPCKPGQLNPYETAIQSVGEIIQDYSKQKEFIALGFGARLPTKGIVTHEFALNGNPRSPYCYGTTEVLEAYRKTLKSVQLYGPAQFAPCINHVAKFAEAAADSGDYYILLLLTDGNIADMFETTEAIVDASRLPISIIIVGLGEADFDEMKVLDGDEVTLSSMGTTAERDIVQFVAMRDFVNKDEDSSVRQARLSNEVLEEIPEQFLSYMKKHNIEPRTGHRNSVPSKAPPADTPAGRQGRPSRLPPLTK